MGQNSSMMSRITLQLETAIVKLEAHAATLKEVANLKRETFQNLITEINKAVAGITDSKGCRLQFNVVAGTMEGHNWKSTVRVDCWKIDAMTTSVSSQCRFSLRQFQKLYDELMFLAAKVTCTADSHRLKYSDTRRDEAPTHSSWSGRAEVGESTDDGVEAGPADEMCSLCQECSTDVSLSCGHCYCQACLDKWLHIAEKKPSTSIEVQTQKAGDCPLCKPSKEYEELLKMRAARGAAPLRVRISAEMADELTSIPERIHAQFAEKRGRNATSAAGTGIQRLVPTRSDSDPNASDDDADCGGGATAGAAKKDSGAMGRAKQLFGLGHTGVEKDTDNLLASRGGSLSSAAQGHDRK